MPMGRGIGRVLCRSNDSAGGDGREGLFNARGEERESASVIIAVGYSNGMRAAVATVLFCLNILGQPGIRQNGVMTMASRIPPTLAGGAIARGTLFTIYGVRLGAAGHTTVSIAKTPVTIVSVDPRRIDAWMPQSAALGNGALGVPDR